MCFVQSQRFRVRAAAVWLALGAFAVPVAALEVDTVPVGNPANPADTRYETPGYGAVDHAYDIGKFEVTTRQYVEFLNAVAKTDPHGLYSPNMAFWEPFITVQGCNIQRSGSPGEYVYSVEPDWADRPVNYVSWGDAARFANWLHNGQPTGAQGPGTTEDGSYLLNGATTAAALLAVTRKPGATWVLPSEDEWYKAAYHKNDGPTGNYWEYPTGSDTSPSNLVLDPDPGNNANFYVAIGTPYFRTLVGEFENSKSPYGTFDQGGNVMEWNETFAGCTRGGSFRTNDASSLRAAARFSLTPTVEIAELGFRVARRITAPAGRFDFDGNGHVDAADYTAFAACVSGPHIARAETPACAAADADGDGDVDQDDFGRFQRCYSGASHAVDPHCEE